MQAEAHEATQSSMGLRGVRGVSGNQSTQPSHNTGQPPVKPCECVREWGSLHQGRLCGGAVTNCKFFSSVRCSLLKKLVEVFVNFKPTKSEEKVIWILGEVRL